jgi:hypothetical protein
MYIINTDLVRSYAQRYAQISMVDTVRIDRPGDPSLDTTSGNATSTVLSTIYEGVGKVTTISGPVQYQLGEEPQYFSSGEASIPLLDVDGDPTTPQVNDVLIVVSHHDVLMVGRAFRIMDVKASGLIEAARTLTLSGVQRWAGWTPDSNIPPEWYV